MKSFIFFLAVFFSFFLCGSDIFEEKDYDLYPIEDVVRTASLCPNHWHSILTIKKFYEAINFQDYDTLSRMMQKKIYKNEADLYVQAKHQYAQSYILAHADSNQKMIETLHLGIKNGWSPIPDVNIINMLTWAFQQNDNIIERYLWDKRFLKYLIDLLKDTKPLQEYLIKTILAQLTQSRNLEYLEMFTQTTPHSPSFNWPGTARNK